MTTSLSPIAALASHGPALSASAHDGASRRPGPESVNARLAALLAANGCPKTYSTLEVAGFFGKTDQWVYWVLRNGVTRGDGSLIEPERVGKSSRRRFTEAIVKEIAVALYRRGTLSENGVREVLVKLDR